MSHEISQLDISDRQLQTSTSQSKASVWTDIGEAEVTHTIFGRARVRIIHKQDKARRTLVLTATAVMVLAALVWQGWIASQTSEPQQSTDPAAVLNSSEPESAPSPGESKQPAISQQSVPPQPAMDVAVPMSAKPVIARPLIASKPQTPPPVATDNASNIQTGMQSPIRSPAASQPAAPAAVKPAATQSAPLAKEVTPAPSPASDNQAAPISAQPQP